MLIPVHAANDAVDRVAEARALRVALLVRVEGLADAHFDRFLPLDLRAASAESSTPLQVAARASQWLTELRIKSLVDIGSGVGKFSIAAALGSRCRFIGIEPRSRLVRVASDLSRLFGVEHQVRFVTAVFEEMLLSPAECYYLFKPGADRPCEAGDAERLLRGLPVGRYVLTYDGSGAWLPDDFEEVRVDSALPGVLRLFRRRGHAERSRRRARRASSA